MTKLEFAYQTIAKLEEKLAAYEIAKEPIALTVNEGMEQAADIFARDNDWPDDHSIYEPLKEGFIAGYQSNPGYAKAIEDVKKLIDNYSHRMPDSLVNDLIEQLKQLTVKP